MQIGDTFLTFLLHINEFVGIYSYIRVENEVDVFTRINFVGAVSVNKRYYVLTRLSGITLLCLTLLF
jgi:hypothetical protein